MIDNKGKPVATLSSSSGSGPSSSSSIALPETMIKTLQENQEAIVEKVGEEKYQQALDGPISKTDFVNFLKIMAGLPFEKAVKVSK